MDTKDTAEKTAPSAASANQAAKPRPGEPKPEEPVPSVPLSWLEDHSLEGLGGAFSGLCVRAPEGKAKEKGAVDMGVEEEDRADEHDPSDQLPFAEKSS